MYIISYNKMTFYSPLLDTSRPALKHSSSPTLRPASRPVLPPYSLHRSYNINKLRKLLKNVDYESTRFVELNFRCAEKLSKPLSLTVKCKEMIKNGTFKVSKYTLKRVLNEIENIPDSGELILTDTHQFYLFKNINLEDAFISKYYSFNIFDVRKYLKSRNMLSYHKDSLNFYPHGANYKVTRNYLAPYLPFALYEPKYNFNYTTYSYLPSTLKFLTHIKNVKNLNDGCRLRLSETQKILVFGMKEHNHSIYNTERYVLQK